MEFIDGGVTAAIGFTASGLHCGIRKNRSKSDLALIASDRPCAAAGVYTQNLVKGAPVTLTQRNLADGTAQALICNSGIANTCAPDGMEKAEEMAQIAADVLELKPTDIVVASTGVIGPSLPTENIRAAAPALKAALSREGSHAAAEAIMTTDTVAKEVAVSCVIGGRPVKIGGISKGSGMIHPNMATMLCFVTSDCAISSAMLGKAVKTAADATFNMISVDGDTSTNDTCCVLASGLADNPVISEENEDYRIFYEGLHFVCETLAKKIAGDGEGATKLVTCLVENAKDEDTAEVVAKAVISSSLVKAAMFGADANWGRVLCAMGYSGADCEPEKTSVAFSSAEGRISVCEQGQGLIFDEDLAKKILTEPEVTIEVDMAQGESRVMAWGCDLTYDYVKINGDYRS